MLKVKMIIVHDLVLFPYFLYVDYVKAHTGEIKAVKKSINLDQIMEMQQAENYAYFNFVEYFVSSVIGKSCFKQNCCDKPLSQYATISDEAFAILIFENNLDAWIDMGMRKDTSGTEVPRKYTNGGKSKGEVASSQHNKGWSNQGLKRFNNLFDKVKENRSAPQAKVFEESFRSYCEEKASSKKKRVAPSEQESFAVRHKLYSENEDGIADTSNNAENQKQKKMKMPLTYIKTEESFDTHEADTDNNDVDETEDEGEQPDPDGLYLLQFENKHFCVSCFEQII